MRVLASSRGLRASVLLLVGTFISGFGLLILASRAEFHAVVAERSIAIVQEGRMKEVETAVLEMSSRVDAVARLLREHRDGAAPLRLLEEHLQPEIGISTVSIDYMVPLLTVSVHAPNAGVIARQASALESDPRILAVDLGRLDRDLASGRYETELSVRFDPALLIAFPKLSE